MKFTVTNRDGSQPDFGKITRSEFWARDMSKSGPYGFAIVEDGRLIVFDGPRNVTYCPPDRFTVQFEEDK